MLLIFCFGLFFWDDNNGLGLFFFKCHYIPAISYAAKTSAARERAAETRKRDRDRDGKKSINKERKEVGGMGTERRMR